MRVLVVGPPLYGLLYPMLSLAQGLRSGGHDVVVASAGTFTQRVAEAGLVGFDAAPDLDSEAEYRRREADRHRQQLGTKMGRFSFFSDEMADRLLAFARDWRPDLVVYPPLGVVGPLVAAALDVPVVMQGVGFGHTRWHVDGVTRSLEDAYARHGIDGPPADLAWIDVTPPSMSVMKPEGAPVLSMRYVPYNGGTVWQDWWTDEARTPRIVVSLGTLKPMVDGLGPVDWVMDSAGELDAHVVLHLGHNARAGLRRLPDNVTLVDWIPMGPLLTGAAGFIHHGGAGNTLTALSSGVPQIVFGQGADRPANAAAVVERGCGVVPPDGALTTELVGGLLDDGAMRAAAREVAAEMRRQPPPHVVADRLAGWCASVAA